MKKTNYLEPLDKLPIELQDAIITEFKEIIFSLQVMRMSMSDSEFDIICDCLTNAGTKLGGKAMTAMVMGKETSEIFPMLMDATNDSKFIQRFVSEMIRSLNVSIPD